MASKWFSLRLGPAINLEDNIRVENNRLFFKTDPIIEPYPSILFRIGPIVINKDGGGVALVHEKHLKIAATFLYEGEPYEGPKMDERERSFFLGGVINIYGVIFQYYKDIESKSEGSVFKLTYAPEFTFGKFMISPRPYYQIWSNGYVDYYFGVKSTELDISRNRSAYSGSATANLGFNIRVVYTEGPWKYFISLGQKFYGDQIESSPTVLKIKSGRVILGFMYKFF
jgi:hypothetical protein